jgi:aldehyde dehydrogenase (NAD+)
MSSGDGSWDLDAGRVRERHREAATEVLAGRAGQHYVGGEWADGESGKTFATVDPTTGEELAQVRSGTAGDVDMAVEAALAADGWDETSLAERQRVLAAVADRVEAMRETFATIETLDNGKPITEAIADIDQIVDEFRYFAGASRLCEGTAQTLDGNRHFEIIREPYGIVGQIVPWNYPLKMATLGVAPALAAGNRVVVKPAEQTPLSILRFARAVDDVVPDGVLNVVNGYGPTTGEALASHPDIGKVGFIGSTEVGRKVMKSAAETITDVTLELGGKNALVVCGDVDVDRAAEIATDAAFHNTGECCTAGSRLFVHEAVRESFLEAFLARVESLRIGDPLKETTDLGPKVSDAQCQRTMEYVQLARDGDGEILLGGGRPSAGFLGDGSFVEPTVVRDVDHDSRVAQEEIFGPVGLVFEWSEYDTGGNNHRDA